MDTPRVLRDIANVLNLSTPLGLVLGAVARGRFRRRSSLVIVDRARLPLLRASAVTVGSVVIIPTRSLEEAEARVPTLMAHEDEHAWQWAYCLGLPFVPLYVASMAWSMVRSGDRATANHFEVQAGLAAGGYREGQKRPVREGIRRLLRG
ncbi:hypothetical protein [Tessaracoccus flavus]|uniref:Uncharacterized protein n=1 Tax=Tessaracoccus flavus TaxID=1610493 RepID=A0A1Q2CGR4_9ACTN|nr:hypothetical protein [Tessaracoccus flavus]AQP45293.1 hypothetical protein RPIT_11205 [Tessaracoccus flavus]SDY49924.1 hypothetical protein SAMN05428934_10263 [Tessaracoccus flavus]